MATKEYRKRYVIIANILGIINDSKGEGAFRTSIMYKSFLSHAQLKEYLQFLVGRGLIDELPLQIENNNGKKKYSYKITEKGLRLLKVAQEIENLIIWTNEFY
jgi:predicted transcriptional regulator